MEGDLLFNEKSNVIAPKEPRDHHQINEWSRSAWIDHEWWKKNANITEDVLQLLEEGILQLLEGAILQLLEGAILQLLEGAIL